MKTSKKEFRRKSRCYIPIPTKSPMTIQRERKTKELLSNLRKRRSMFSKLRIKIEVTVE